jgi:hypothetical protein
MTSISGAIHCNNVSGNINAKTENGNIKITDVKGSVTTENSGGETEFSNVTGKLASSAVEKDIKGTNLMITDDSKFESKSGNIELKLLNHQKALTFELFSTSGTLEINNNKGLNVLKIDGGNIKITGTTISGNQKYECVND